MNHSPFFKSANSLNFSDLENCYTPQNEFWDVYIEEKMQAFHIKDLDIEASDNLLNAGAFDLQLLKVEPSDTNQRAEHAQLLPNTSQCLPVQPVSSPYLQQRIPVVDLTYSPPPSPSPSPSSSPLDEQIDRSKIQQIDRSKIHDEQIDRLKIHDEQIDRSKIHDGSSSTESTDTLATSLHCLQVDSSVDETLKPSTDDSCGSKESPAEGIGVSRDEISVPRCLITVPEKARDVCSEKLIESREACSKESGDVRPRDVCLPKRKQSVSSHATRSRRLVVSKVGSKTLEDPVEGRSKQLNGSKKFVSKRFVACSKKVEGTKRFVACSKKVEGSKRFVACSKKVETKTASNNDSTHFKIPKIAKSKETLQDGIIYKSPLVNTYGTDERHENPKNLGYPYKEIPQIVSRFFNPFKKENRDNPYKKINYLKHQNFFKTRQSIQKGNGH